MGDVDVFATPENIVLQKGKDSLWCSRKNGELTPKTGKRVMTYECTLTFGGEDLISY